MTIGQRIKEARKNAGLTQRELAEISGTATGTIQQYELGKRQPRLEQLRRIANALDADWVSLVGDDPSMKGRAMVDVVKRQDACEFERLLGLKEGSVTDMSSELKDGESIISTLARTDDEANNLADILGATKKLNSVGQCVAVERVRELGKIPEYQREQPTTAPQLTLFPQVGEDTTPPPDAPETPPEVE